jgi:DNA-binding CsgD family transcriptional regulator
MRQIPDTFIAELNKTIDSEIYGRNLMPAIQPEQQVIFHPLHLSYRFDYAEKKVAAISGSLRSMLGYHPYFNTDIFGLVFQLSESVSDSEKSMIRSMREKALEYFLFYKKSGELKSLNFSFEYKVKRIRGDYAWLLHQMTIVSTAFDGTPQVSSNVITDITAQKRDDKICFTISKLDKDMLYTPIHVITESSLNNASGLSDRELEILELLRLGKSSHEISESLFISTHTVNTHRKNMLKKAGAKNTAELLFMLFAA